jgi:RNase P/RNase MRP subunit POP5
MRKRYLLVKAISERSLSSEEFERTLLNSVRTLFGEFGLARIHPKLIRFDSNTSEAVIACNHEGASALLAAVGLISGASDASVSVLTIRLSGTIKGLRRRQRF